MRLIQTQLRVSRDLQDAMKEAAKISGLRIPELYELGALLVLVESGRVRSQEDLKTLGVTARTAMVFKYIFEDRGWGSW